MIQFDRKKDKVGIVAPSSANSNSENLLKNSIAKLAEHGFECKYEEDIFKRNGLIFFAADRAIRLSHLKNAILDPEVKIIWAFRGGYGSTEIILDCLDVKPSCPKIIIGISDITPLLLLFNQHYKMPAIHGPGVTILMENPQMFPEMMRIFSGKKTFFPIKPINDSFQILNDKIKGKIIGGNLTLFCNMIGTKLHPKTAGKILLFEDVNEKGYKIHRNLVHLKNAGLFKDVKAIIFADFTKGDEHIISAIQGFCAEHIPHIPAFKVENIGHGEINHPVCFGSNCSIDSKQLIINNNFKLV